MSDTNTRVPSVLAHELPRPVPMDELAACPASEVFRRVGDKWSMLVVILLGGRAHRYNELHRAIEGISQRMLTRTLRGLEDDGLVWRHVHPTVPPGVEYGLTELGVSLLEPLSALADWAVRHAPEMAEARGAEAPGAETRAAEARRAEARRAEG
ncbi:winged helix-turn-helix transcriptional regulator [Nonomuraea soli]|uniref:DNA-binding HxlR family transcriptional regulator n=1 Tax=Nonomuraea soli TaxID=1032476 RepID=A0A7W0HW62_9ACTN|nr:helix-turn-helix domain-containing protein [Nonomuraea soli]MBA2897938.1 DNA-binding HxlR family transcriptional regulator [Nonomuraea soli]